MMHRIYANATMNIGATHGKDSRASLFSERTRTPPLQHFAEWRPFLDGNQILVEIRQDDIHVPHKVDQHPLFGRAWQVTNMLQAKDQLLSQVTS